jgi:hypothetical protein
MTGVLELNDSFHIFFISARKIKYVISIALGYRLHDWEFESRQGLEIFLFTTSSRLALGPTQLPVQWLPGSLSLRVKRPGHEADHSPPYTVEVKEFVGL